MLIGIRRSYSERRAIVTILIYGLIVGGVAIGVMRWPAIAMGLVLCSYGLEQWAAATHPFFVAHQTVGNYVTGSVLVWAVIVQARRHRLGADFLHYPITGWLVLALLFWSFVSLAWAMYPEGATSQWMKLWPYIVAIVLCGPLLITNLRDVQAAMWAALVIAVLLVPLLLIGVEWSGRHITLATGERRATNPLAVASVGAYALLLVTLLDFRRFRWLFRWLRWVIAALAVVLIVMTGSRGQFFAAIVALLALLPLSRGIYNWERRSAVLFAMAMTVAVAGWALSEMAEGSRWTMEHMVATYSTGRLAMCGELLTAWLEAGPIHWVLGLGNSASFSPNLLGGYPHVVPVEVLAEEGLVGLALLIGICYGAWRSVRYLIQVAKPYPDARAIVAVIAALLLFQFLLTLKQGSMLGSSLFFALTIIVSRAASGVAREQATYVAITATPSWSSIPEEPYSQTQ